VFKDADTYVDLFGYHLADSNNDGIPNLAIRHDEKALIVNSQGIRTTRPRSSPTAVTEPDPRPGLSLPPSLEPKKAASITRVPMGPIGVALNGVVFFNPFEAGGMNAIEGIPRSGSTRVAATLSRPVFTTIINIRAA